MTTRIGLTRKQFKACGFNSRYPKTASQAAMELRQRGYNVFDESPGGHRHSAVEKLKNLTRRGIIELPDAEHLQPKWTASAIDGAAKYFEQRGDYAPGSAFYATLGIQYFDVLMALKDIHRSVREEFGTAATAVLTTRPNIDDFTLHLESGRGESDGRVWFTLREDTQEQIEKVASEA